MVANIQITLTDPFMFTSEMVLAQETDDTSGPGACAENGYKAWKECNMFTQCWDIKDCWCSDREGRDQQECST